MGDAGVMQYQFQESLKTMDTIAGQPVTDYKIEQVKSTKVQPKSNNEDPGRVYTPPNTVIVSGNNCDEIENEEAKKKEQEEEIFLLVALICGILAGLFCIATC